MRVQLLNGTSGVVPMNGTSGVLPSQGTSGVMPMNGDDDDDDYGLNGIDDDDDDYGLNGIDDDDDDELNGTSNVVPMDGTSGVLPAQGTSGVMPMNGDDDDDDNDPLQGFFEEDDDDVVLQGFYDDDDEISLVVQGTSVVVPMQGASGDIVGVRVHPLALMHPDDVPMQGVPDDYTQQDIDNYKVAYLYGDRDALQGLFGKLRDKIKKAQAGNQQARTDRRERRAERRDKRVANRDQRREMRAERQAKGEGFFQKVGDTLKDVGKGLKAKFQAQADLDESGIDYNQKILDQRSLLGSGAIGQWWDEAPTWQKGLAVLGVGLGAKYVYDNYIKKGKSKRK